MRDALSDQGSLWLHLDYRAVHDAKLICDRLFGRGQFAGEVIWVPGNGGKKRSGLSVTHQTLLIYGKTKTVIYNWTTTSLSAGSHTLKVQIDPNATFVLFDVGGTVMTTTFIYNQSGYGTINALLWVAVIVLAVVAFLVYRRPAPRKKK